MMIQRGQNRIKLPESIASNFAIWGKISDDAAYFYTLYSSGANLDEKKEQAQKAIESVSSKNNIFNRFIFNIVLGKSQDTDAAMNEYTIFIEPKFAEGNQKEELFTKMPKIPTDTIENVQILIQNAQYPLFFDEEIDRVGEKIKEVIDNCIMIGRPTQPSGHPNAHYPTYPNAGYAPQNDQNIPNEDEMYAPGRRILIRRIDSAKPVARVPLFFYIIMSVNISLFFLVQMNGGPTSENLMRFGAAEYLHIFEAGQYYRLLSSIFLHIGHMHIIFNSVALMIFGSRAERYFGNIRFLIIYLASGIVGAFSMVWGNPFVPGAGASGAIFGILGAMVAFMLVRKKTIEHISVGTIMFLIIINFMFSIMPGNNISNMAHLGGLITGFILGLPLFYPYKRRDDSNE